VILLLIVIGCGAGIANFVVTKRLWAVLDTPRVPTGHVAIGRTEVSGAAFEAPGVIVVTSPLCGARCVWWQVDVEQQTGSGNNKSWLDRVANGVSPKGRAVSWLDRVANGVSPKGRAVSWKSSKKVTSAPLVHVDDGSGPVLVSIVGPPSNVSIRTYSQDMIPLMLTTNHFTRSLHGVAPKDLFESVDKEAAEAMDRTMVQRLLSEITQDANPSLPISQLGGTWRVTERYIERGTNLYVLGHTTYDPLSHRAQIVTGKNRPLFVHVGTEQDLTSSLRWKTRMNSALLITGATFGPLLVGRDDQSDTAWNFRAAAVSLVLLLLWWLITWSIRIRNRLVAARQQVKAGAGLVEIALTKRSHLIPTLVEVVQAATTHADAVVGKLTELRGVSTGGEDAVKQLRVTAQSYPALSTSANFVQLQESLEDVETDLAMAQGFVVDAETVQRTRLQSFPDSLVARLLRLG
jgi:LemA protein